MPVELWMDAWYTGQVVGRLNDGWRVGTKHSVVWRRSAGSPAVMTSMEHARPCFDDRAKKSLKAASMAGAILTLVPTGRVLLKMSSKTASLAIPWAFTMVVLKRYRATPSSSRSTMRGARLEITCRASAQDLGVDGGCKRSGRLKDVKMVGEG